MEQSRLTIILLIIALILTNIFWLQRSFQERLSIAPSPKSEVHNNSMFKADFNLNKVIEESGDLEESKDPNWWVNSGGQFIQKNQLASTILGDLPENSNWQKKYAKSNSKDTDGGFHPQNIFRLVTKHQWQDLNQQVYFKILKNNLSKSSNRNQSNGVLLFNRYKDGDNLYYVGLRVDGDAVIKKKLDGKYFTLSQKRVFGSGEYNRDTRPNILPTNTWIGIKSTVLSIDDEQVEIKLYVDKLKNGNWEEVLSSTDDEDIIDEEGHAGIRTDFMDVQFDDYQVTKIDQNPSSK